MKNKQPEVDKDGRKREMAADWIVTIDDVVIPETEYDWTEEGNFFFPKTILELAQEYCSIHKNYQVGDKVTVQLKMCWMVELTKND